MAKHAVAVKEAPIQDEPDALPPLAPTAREQIQNDLKASIASMVEAELIHLLAENKKKDAAAIADAANAEWQVANQEMQKARLALTAAIRLANNVA